MQPAESPARVGSLQGLRARTRAIRSYATVVVFSGLTSVMSFVTAIVLARVLTEAEFGEYSVFISMVVVFLTATNFGDAAYVRFAQTEAGRARAYLQGTFLIELTAALVLIAIAYPLGLLLARTAFQSPGLTGAVAVGIGVGGSLSLVALLGAVHQAAERFGRYASLNAVFYAGALIAVVTIWAVGADLTLPRLFVVYGALAAVIFGLSFWRLWRAAGPPAPERVVVKRLLTFSKWLVGANIAYLVFQRLDILMVARYANEATVGQYGVALRVGVLASLFTGSIAPYLLPRATRTGRSSDELKKYVRVALLLSGFLLVLIAVLILLIPWIIPLLFGERYRAAIPIARLLLAANACVALYTPAAQLFLADDRPRRTFAVSWIKLVTLGPLLVWLTPGGGAVGAAKAVAASEVITLAYVVSTARRQLRRTWSTPTAEADAAEASRSADPLAASPGDAR